jgi:Na+/serine symporter
MIPTKMYVAIHSDGYSPLLSYLDLLVVFVALLGFVSIIVNAQLQYSKTEPTKT